MRMSVPASTLATWACTESPLQAMTMLAIRARWAREAPAPAAATLPRSISKSPARAAGTRLRSMPMAWNSERSGTANSCSRPMTWAMRTKTEKSMINPQIISRVFTESVTASPRI